MAVICTALLWIWYALVTVFAVIGVAATAAFVYVFVLGHDPLEDCYDIEDGP